MANGDFSASTRLKVRLKAEDMFQNGNRRTLHLNSDQLMSAKALLARQVADVAPLERPDKDDQVEITWMEKTGATVTDPCTDNCDFTGPRAGSYGQTYSLTDCVEHTFSINSNDFRNNDHEITDELAVQLLEADFALAKQLNTKAIAFMNSSIGTSENTPTIATANDANGIVIPAAQWNSQLFAHLSLTADLNGFAAPFLVSGGELYIQDWLVARDTSDGAEGRRTAFKGMDTWFDVKGLADDAENPIYMIDSSAYALAIKNRVVGEVNHGYEGRISSTWNSVFLPGYTYDVHTRKTCQRPGETVTHYLIEARTGLFTAPTTQTTPTNTGFLKIKQS